MRRKIWKVCILSVILLMTFALIAGCSPEEPAVDDEDPEKEEPREEEVQVNFSAVPAGPGVWYVVAEGIMDSIGRSDLPVETGEILPGSTVPNVMNVSRGETELGIATAAHTVSGIEGEEPLYDQEYENVGQMLNLFPAYHQAVIKEEAEIESWDDLPGHSVNHLDEGGSSEVTNRQIFELAGLTYDDLSRSEFLWFDAAYDLMRDCRLDANFSIAPLPHPHTEDLSHSIDIDLLPMDDELIDGMKEINPGFQKGVIPGGSYEGVEEDVQTIETGTILMVNLDLSEDLVYSLTEYLVENWEEEIAPLHPMLDVDVEDLARDSGVPLHPGAEKYFQDIGVLD